MDPEFSEFSYGYSIIKELEDLAAAAFPAGVGRPIMPSLREEKKVGWDAAITTVFFVMFLQFKRGEFVSRRNAGSPTWPAVRGPHYRFKFDTAGDQFKALSSLATALHGQPAQVSYIAPRFHRSARFSELHRAKNVLASSYGCLPTEVPTSTGPHYRVVSEDGTTNLFCSDPVTTYNSMNRDQLADMMGSATTDSALSLERLVEILRVACVESGLSLPNVDLGDVTVLTQLTYWTDLIGAVPILWDSPAGSETAEGSEARR